MCLFLCKYHTVLATIALKHSLKSETEMLCSSFSRLLWLIVVFHVFIQILGLCAIILFFFFLIFYIFFFNFFFFFFFTLQYCIGFTIHQHASTTGVHVFPILNPPSQIPPYTIPLGHHSAPTPSFLYPASNLDGRLLFA